MFWGFLPMCFSKDNEYLVLICSKVFLFWFDLKPQFRTVLPPFLFSTPPTPSFPPSFLLPSLPLSFLPSIFRADPSFHKTMRYVMWPFLHSSWVLLFWVIPWGCRESSFLCIISEVLTLGPVLHVCPCSSFLFSLPSPYFHHPICSALHQVLGFMLELVPWPTCWLEQQRRNQLFL